MKFFTIYFSTLFSLLQLFTIGIFSRDKRMFMHQVNILLYNMKNPPIEKELPCKKLDDIIPTDKVISIAEIMRVQGNTTSYEQLTLSMFVKSINPKTIFEIGTFDGRTTLNFAINAEVGTQIYTLDLPKEEEDTALLNTSRSDQNLIKTNVTGLRFLSEQGQKLTEGRSIKQLFGDTATFDFSPYYSSSELVFVDAAHTYEYVKNDSEAALKLLKNGKGVILWHDYDDKHQGSVQAINEILEENPDWNMFHIADTNIAGLMKP